MNEVVNRLQKQFMGSSEWLAADGALRQAEAAYDSETKPLLTALHNTPAYKSALQQKEGARQRVDELQQNTAATSEQVGELARESLAASSALTKMDEDAVGADPTAVNLKAACATAAAKCSDLHAQFQKSLAASSEWQAAKAAKDKADKAVSDAETQVAIAARKVSLDESGR